MKGELKIQLVEHGQNDLSQDMLQMSDSTVRHSPISGNSQEST